VALDRPRADEQSLGRASYARTAVILDGDGREVARVVYRPDRPLPCGARCWVETGLRVVALA
jgi:hypothetical protein